MGNANWKPDQAVSSRTLPSPLWINLVFHFMFIFSAFCRSFEVGWKIHLRVWLIEEVCLLFTSNLQWWGRQITVSKKKTESRSKTAAGTIVNRHKSQIQRDIADTCIYSRRLYTKTYSLLKIGGSCWEVHHTELEGWQHFFFNFFFSFRKAPPADSKKPTLLLLCMKYGTKMNYTQHLLIWHAKYTRLMRQYRSFCGGTPVPPQCDMAVTPHLCAPTVSFCLNVLLIHSIFHVTQCLTSLCSAWQAGCIIECSLWFGSV